MGKGGGSELHMGGEITGQLHWDSATRNLIHVPPKPSQLCSEAQGFPEVEI